MSTGLFILLRTGTLALLGPCQTSASSAQEKKMRAGSLEKWAQICLGPPPPHLACAPCTAAARLGGVGPREPWWGQVSPASHQLLLGGVLGHGTPPPLACPQLGVLDAIPITKTSRRGLLESPDNWKETFL